MDLTAASTVSSYWVLVDSSSPQVRFVNDAPILSVSSHLPDDTFKEDISLKVKVQNEAKSESSEAIVEGVNFPVVIKDVPNADVLSLPASASGKEMKIDMNKFFTGPI